MLFRTPWSLPYHHFGTWGTWTRIVKDESQVDNTCTRGTENEQGSLLVPGRMRSRQGEAPTTPMRHAVPGPGRQHLTSRWPYFQASCKGTTPQQLSSSWMGSNLDSEEARNFTPISSRNYPSTAKNCSMVDELINKI